MHELSLMTYLLEAVQQRAQALGAKRVLTIDLTMGERAGIDDSLLYYFDELSPGTLAQGAKINIRRTAMKFYCEPCAVEYQPRVERADFGCPRCGRVGDLRDDASDLRIESMEIET